MKEITQENIQTVKDHMERMEAYPRKAKLKSNEATRFMDEVEKCRNWIVEAKAKLESIHHYEEFKLRETLNFIYQ